MDDVVPLLACSCVALSALVYLMWRSATREEWHELAVNEKKRWRDEEKRRKGQNG